MALFAGDVFVVVAPLYNTEKVKYYLMCCRERKMKLLVDNDDNCFIYERGSITLKSYLFQETYQIKSHVHFQYYQLDVISFQYSPLVCSACIKLLVVQSKKKWKVKKRKMTKADHERIIEDDIPLRYL
jgi:hypothetical protein